MGNPALNKQNLFGFKMQEGHQQAPTAADWVWVPYVDEPSFKWNPHPESIDQADRIHHDHLLYPGGEWYEGSVSLQLCPGAVSSLVSWIQTRDVYNQGSWASVYFVNYDTAARHEIYAMDVKVAKAEFAIETGSPLRVNLDLVGLAEGSIGGKPTTADYDGTEIAAPASIAPYICKETTFKYKATNGAGAYASPTDTDYEIRNCSINIDNQLQDPAEGMRFNGSANPYRLYNEGGVKVTGSFSRDFIDANVYNAFRNMYRSAAGWYIHDNTGALKISISRGTTLTIEIPRLGYNDHSSGMRGSRSGVLVESVDFIALGARTSVSPGTVNTDFPIVLT